MNAAPRSDTVDTYHGIPVADPFRPLEDPAAPATVAWVEQQNRATEQYLSRYAGREQIARRLTQLYDHARLGVPEKHGDHYFFTRNDGLQNQAVLYRQEGIGGDPFVVINPNALSDDGTTALTLTSFSHDGALLAYGLSTGGSDRQVIRIRQIESGTDYPEVIRWCKFASVAWKRDGSGFFYNRFPEPGTVPPEDENNYARVYWHRLGTPQHEDMLIFERPDDKELDFAPWITEDGSHLFLLVSRGTDERNGLYVRAVESDEPFLHLLEPEEAACRPIETMGATLLVHTDLEAPRGRVMAIDLARPARDHWREVVPQTGDTLDYALLAHDALVLVYLHDAHHMIALHGQDGAVRGQITLPALGAINGIWGSPEERELFLSFTSYLYPATILRYDVAGAKLSVFHQPEIGFPLAEYETTQVFATSRDGTRVPMFLTHRRGLRRDGTHPTLLYGYGGFNISLTPSFSVSTLLWLEQGGIYAVANLRGGGEFGEEWHQAGMLDRKQHVFDDFIACAEWLIANDYTCTRRLAIQGGSNGGLLVAACLVQRPELFGAVVCQVPVTDMLRYHRFTVGRYWIPEYGNAGASEEEFRVLAAYSPLHNVRAGIDYPPILIASADTDDRVVPAHAKKFAATLQELSSGAHPMLLRVETRAGHGAGKPIAKVIEEQTDIYAFLFLTLGIAAAAG